jgi:uncharacterized membrane protein
VIGELVFFGLLMAAGPIVLIVLVVFLARAFTRIRESERRIGELQDRIIGLEAAAEPIVQAPKPVVPPQPAVPPAPPRPITPEPEAVAPSLPSSPSSPSSLEEEIGSRWLLYVGVIAIVIGVAYVEKLAFDNQWIGPLARVMQGAIAGFALIYAGLTFARRGYAGYGQMISGAGSAILYVSTYAAFNYYSLIDRPVAFFLMAAITFMTAALADWQRAQGLAVLAVGGGFLTPFLLPGPADAQIALFTYDAILIAGAVYLARRREWPLLNVISYFFTLITCAAWVDRFYLPGKYLRTEIFFSLYCAMFVYILIEGRRSSAPAATAARFFLWTAPAAYYFASLAILIDHPTAILVWLVCMTLIGAALTTRFGPAVGLTSWLLVTIPLLVWIDMHDNGAWLRDGLATVAGIYAIALVTQLYDTWEREEFGPVDIVWLHANGLLMFAAAHFLIAPVDLAITSKVAAAFAVWQWILAGTLVRRRRDQAIHFIALGFTLLAIAIALQYDGPALTVAWAAEGAVVVALGLRERRAWMQLGGAVLFMVAIARAADVLVGPGPAIETFFFNPRVGCGAFVIALSYGLAWLYHRNTEAAAGRAAAIATSLIAAQILSLVLLTTQIEAYWSGLDVTLTRELMTSVTWALYATVLIVIGLRRDYAPIRYFAIVLFAATSLKVFTVDLWIMNRVYRVLSIIGLGVALLVSSFLYQATRRNAKRPIDDLNGRR